MKANFYVFCISLLLLLNLIGAKPLSELQVSNHIVLFEDEDEDPCVVRMRPDVLFGHFLTFI